MHLCIRTRTLVGPQRFISGSICNLNPLERHRRFTSPSKQAADSQNFWRLQNTATPVYMHRRVIFPHFAGARAKGNRSFRTYWQRLASFRTFGRSISCSDLQLICQIYADWSVIEGTCMLRVPGLVDNQ